MRGRDSRLSELMAKLRINLWYLINPTVAPITIPRAEKNERIIMKKPLPQDSALESERSITAIIAPPAHKPHRHPKITGQTIF